MQLKRIPKSGLIGLVIGLFPTIASVIFISNDNPLAVLLGLPVLILTIVGGTISFFLGFHSHIVGAVIGTIIGCIVNLLLFYVLGLIVGSIINKLRRKSSATHSSVS